MGASGDGVERESGGRKGVRLTRESRAVVCGGGSKGKVIHADGNWRLYSANQPPS